MATIPELFDAALRIHQAGDLLQATQLYRRILQADPNHADCLHLLGIATFQTGRHETGIALIRQAIALNPSAAVYHSNLGVYLKELGRLPEAVECYRQALKLNPQYVDALSNLGIALRDQGHCAEADECCRQALRLNPQHAEAYSNLGVALKDQGRLAEAIRALGIAEIAKIEALDLFRGKGVPEGHHSLLIRVTFQSYDATLTDAQMAEAGARIVRALESLGAKLRAS